MSIPFERIAILGATGPTGFHLAVELRRRGRSLRAISRNREHLETVFAATDTELRAADALDPEALRRAIDGCDLVVDCIGLPPDRMDDHPATAHSIADAARSAGARCLQVSSYWSFFPHRSEVVGESHPRSGGHVWFVRRREAEDILLASGAAVVHLPDFFGPRVHTSFIQMPLEEAVAGRPMTWMGRKEVGREAAYVPDVMRIVADLAERQEAYGTDWALPGNGTLSGRRLADLAERHLGRPVKLRAVPAWMLYLLSLVSDDLRQIRPLIPHYTRPVRYDVGKLEGLLGEIRKTPMDEAIGDTLAWLVSQADG